MMSGTSSNSCMTGVAAVVRDITEVSSLHSGALKLGFPLRH